MLKTLKWVHNLGVTQERTRIASALEAHANRARVSDGMLADMLREESGKKKINQRAIDRLNFSREVNSRVLEVINDIFKTEPSEWLSGYSIMFPNEQEK